MQLLKPKRAETVKQNDEVLKSTRFIFESYSKYTKYTEGEILDHLAIQLLKEVVNYEPKRKTVTIIDEDGKEQEAESV